MKRIAIFSAEESWKMTEADKVLAVIKAAEVWRLSDCDGCMCGGFRLRDIDIKISCGKGAPRGVMVSSESMEYSDIELLRPIAEEVARQVAESDSRGECRIELRAG